MLCSSPDETWSFRRYDTTIFNVDPAFRWPESGLKGLCTICTIYPILPPLTGHHICQLRLILCPLGHRGMDWPLIDRFPVYVHWFDVVGQDAAQLKIVKRAKRANHQRLGDIVPLSQLHAFVQLIPCFGQTADL